MLNDSFYLKNAFTKAGNTSFPNFEGNREEIGHCGNGAAKISFICDWIKLYINSETHFLNKFF